jgi:hypothetical protein
MKKTIMRYLSLLGLFFSMACQPFLPQIENDLEISSGIIRGTALDSNDPVILEYAQLNYKKDQDGRWIGRLEGVANLKNIAYEKILSVVYNDSFGSMEQWKIAFGGYIGTDENGYERWFFVTPWKPTELVTNYLFALKYEVAGQTYWDNNQGRDYRVLLAYGENYYYDGDHAVLNNGAIVWERLYPSTDSWFVGARVKNLGYYKDVSITYTCGWVGQFPNPGLELWW